MNIAEKIVNWIRKQVRGAGAKGLVVGLSGGVDSAAAAALCLKALGKGKVLGLILPCASQKQDISDARLVARTLGIKIKYLDLAAVYKACLKILPRANQVARGNLKPRLRMVVLYYFANKLNYLVCGTSNKSEFMMGYFTKYGDGAEDIVPLGGLLKSEVKQLARDLNIPRKIIDKAPAAGLWPGQTDEAELGISYFKLDDILLRLSKRSRQIQPKGIVNKVKSCIRASEHKRHPPQICKI